MKSAVKIFIGIILVVLSACGKDGYYKNGTGKLKNLTGLDGCGWVIQMQTNGETKNLEPLNLGSFIKNPTDGQDVKFTYNTTNNMSICMVGQTVLLIKLK